MRIAVIGTGHVGLVTCATLAKLGHRVVGTDVDETKIEQCKRGISPFFEPGLEDLLKEMLGAGRLSFTTSMQEALKEAEVAFICVGTPPRASGDANLVAVESVAREIAKTAAGGCVVLEKSTVPAGTAERVRRTIKRARPNLAADLDVASNPEFLREGRAVHDALNPDRILVGAESEKVFEKMREVYAPLIKGGVPMIETDIVTAELSKHASNAFLALKVSYANALARICELSGADVEMVTHVMGADERIGPAFLKPGIGFGGSCFPKDVSAFERLCEVLGYDFGLLREVTKINDEAVRSMASRIKDVLWNLEGKRLAVLGLAFKGGTDDIRFSPAVTLARILIEEGAELHAFDPIAGRAVKEEAPTITIAPDPYAAATQADAVIIATDWAEFRSLDFHRMRSLVRDPIIFDGRNLLDADRVLGAGFTYLATGRPGLEPT
jgi:UDPglucose 6-dehydrogenase